MTILTLLSAVAPIAITMMLVIFGELSRRLGAVVKTGPLHRWFYISALFTFISATVRLYSIEFSEQEFERTGEETFIAYAYTLPLMMGLVISLWVAWRYWGWLVYASDGNAPVPRRQD
jgi:hypothetical protein